MAFARPTLEQLVTRVKTDLEARLNGGGAVLRRSAIAVFARVIAGASHLLHGNLEYIYQQAFPDSSDEENTVRWAAIWGINREPAEFAEGNVTFTGVDGTTVPALTQIQRSDEVLFETQVSGVIASGTLTVAVAAVVAGADGNTDAATIATMAAPITGIDTNVTVAAGGLVGGADEEPIESLRQRLLDRIRVQPLGGAETDYVKWALEVPGVTRAWAYPNHLGPGTVGLRFVRDDDSGSIIPSSGEVTEVQDYIDARRPVTADFMALAPVAAPLNFTIDLTPDTPEIRAAVEAELNDLIRRAAEPGGTLLLSQINEAISIATGEEDHTLTVPSANVTTSTGVLTTMGVITWV